MNSINNEDGPWIDTQLEPKTTLSLTDLAAVADVVDQDVTWKAHGLVCGHHNAVGTVGESATSHCCVGLHGIEANSCKHTSDT